VITKLVVTFLIIWFIYHVRSVFPPFVVGGIIAYLLLPVVQYMSGVMKIKKGHATAIIYLLFLSLVAMIATYFGPTVLDQFAALAQHKEELINHTIVQATSTFDLKVDAAQTTHQIVGAIDETIGRPSEIVHLGGLVSHGLLFVMICVVSSIYFLVDSDRIGEFALRFVPENRRPTVVTLSGQMNRMLSRYVRGQLILIIVMSSVAFVFLHYIMHMKYALPVAILSGFFEIIPVLGPIVATTTATLVGFAQFGVPAAGYIIVFYTLARWFEDYAIVPKIIGHAVELHPLIVIFAVLCGEVTAGALGMLIAIPVAASIKVIVDFTYPDRSKLLLPHGTTGMPPSGNPEPATVHADEGPGGNSK
jgi:predicted PurR-regulated permease PerM